MQNNSVKEAKPDAYFSCFWEVGIVGFNVAAVISSAMNQWTIITIMEDKLKQTADANILRFQ